MHRALKRRTRPCRVIPPVGPTLTLLLTSMLLPPSLLAEEADTAHAPLWQLRAGAPVHLQLETWAQEAGWTLYWRPSVSWRVLADVTFTGSFDDVVSEVLESLFLEGKPVRLMLWEGNRVAEVIQP